QLALIEAYERSIDHLANFHDLTLIVRVDVETRALEDLRPGQSRQHGLHPHTFAGDFGVQRHREVQHERLGRAVRAAEFFGHERYDRCEVNDGASPLLCEFGRSGDRQAIYRDDIDLDHSIQVIEIRAYQWSFRTDTGIVDQHRNLPVLTNSIFDTEQIGL